MYVICSTYFFEHLKLIFILHEFYCVENRFHFFLWTEFRIDSVKGKDTNMIIMIEYVLVEVKERIN